MPLNRETKLNYMYYFGWDFSDSCPHFYCVKEKGAFWIRKQYPHTSLISNYIYLETVYLIHNAPFSSTKCVLIVTNFFLLNVDKHLYNTVFTVWFSFSQSSFMKQTTFIAI